MQFTIIFYENPRGKKPVLDFLDDLQVKNRLLHAALTEGINKLKNRSYHREPLSSPLGEKLFELRVSSGRTIARVIYCFDKGRVIILLHGFLKKTQKLKRSDIKKAKKRMDSYFRRKKANDKD